MSSFEFFGMEILGRIGTLDCGSVVELSLFVGRLEW